MTRILFASILLVLMAFAQSARAEQPPTTLQTLLDKSQIEDLIVEYYTGLGAGSEQFARFYVEDGVLDVNGIIGQGQKGIDELYKKVAAGAPNPPGTFHMLLSNLRIVVNGDSATADVVWTGINSDSVKAAPRFMEQGREHTELVKRNGKWLFKHRVITSDGGMPPMFEKTYKKR